VVECCHFGLICKLTLGVCLEESMGADLGEYEIEQFASYIGYIVVLADALIVLYGLREKTRTRMNIFGHISANYVGCVIKFALKSFIQIVTVLAFAVSCVR
jgi:hypothetical protein